MFDFGLLLEAEGSQPGEAMAFKVYAAAQKVAEATPSSRNRYVDFLRAAAIFAVVCGHWLMAAVWMDGDGFHTANVLGEIEATQWLTWILQVMPLFFLVGGYSNAASWSRANGRYPDWLRGRLQRLVLPTLPLVAAWILIALVGPAFGLDKALAHLGSQVALVPLWFLAVYLLMVAATPVTTRLWSARGIRAVGLLAAGAIVVDGVRAATTDYVGFANYFLVWGAIYLLGHAWHGGTLDRAHHGVVLAFGGALALLTMTLVGPYHVSMVGVPGVEFGNTAPPTAALLALGFTQIGVAIAVQAPMRRFLERRTAWTATVLVNGSIMTLYVWHMTAMALTIGLMRLVAAPLLNVAPAAGVAWWLTRPLWIMILVIATIPFIGAFRRLESGGRGDSSHRVSAVGVLLATLGACIAFGSVAFHGLTSSHPMWVAAAVVPLVLLTPWLKAGKRQPAKMQELPSS